MKVKDVPRWHNPILVAAFGGWGDASSVATTAATYLLQNREVQPVVDFDAEEHFVLSQTRPHVRVDDGGQRRVQWPSLGLVSGAGEPRDLVALLGPEPQLRWRTFARQVGAFWREHGQGGPAVLLGAFLAGVSHAAPTVLTGFATTPEFRERLFALGVHPSGYQGPTGVHSALAEAFEEAGIPCVSIWAAAPHYLAAMPNPKACAAQLRAVDRFFDLGLDLRPLDEAASTFEQQVGIALARSGQGALLAHHLEAEVAPAKDEKPAEPLPPAEDMVRGVEEFLKQRRPD